MSTPDLPLRQLLTPGFRPVDTLCGKLPHSLRILIAGDSYAYGHGLALEEALPSQLQEQLRRDPGLPFCEVVNLGRPGLNVYGELEVLRQVAGRLEADVLVLCLSSDDASPCSRLELERGGHEEQERWRLQWHPDRPDFAYFLRALGTLAEDQRRAGRQLVVVFYEPVSGTTELPLAVLPEVCETLAVPFLDLFSPFARFAPEALVVSTADSHPSPLAHRVGAVELAAVVRPFLAAALSSAPTLPETAREQLARRLEWLRRAERPQRCAGRLVWNHLAEGRDGFGTGLPPGAVQLRELVNRRVWAALLQELLDEAQADVAALGEQLLDLRRQLLLTQLRVDSFLQEPADWAAAGRALLAAGERLRELLQALAATPAISGGDLPEAREGGGGDAAAVVLCCVQQLAGEVELERTRHQSACGGLRELLAEVGLVAARGEELGTVPGTAIQLARGIARSLERLSVLLGPGLRGDLDHRAQLVAEVEMEEEEGVSHVDLVADCRVLFPYSQLHRQVHYVVRDGRRHAYRLDLPPGVVARVTLQLRRYHDQGVELAADAAEVKMIWLTQGEEQRAYRPGMALFAPFPAPGVRRGGGEPCH
jgi:hypothetical protein